MPGCCLSFCVDICSDGAEVMEGKTVGALAHIKQGASHCISGHCVLQHHVLIGKKKTKKVSLKNILDEAVNITNFINS